MEPDLRRRFDLAVSADPGADPGEMAQVAMLHGGRIRHRRRLAVAGSAAAVVALVVAVGAVDLTESAAPPAGRPAMVTAGMRLPAPECSPEPVATDATDVVIFLPGATARQRSAIGQALHDDERIASWLFESREEAYARFAEHYQDSPDFVGAVDRDSVPEAFRLRLRDPARFSAFRQEYAAKPGVGTVVGRVCPASAPLGGIL
ncbi:permease-like cell division protein FtsX [Actinoplanes oblitus]|uniref:Permease-like cell division protein FtsX n=1 Tax=Actinoplanes oblitus TaxID=3040509 RepID=A0ABY8W9P7_9ACTN|nr:permease-like cell division protein FtsX [Actinoplanes oblitus]WIM94082.1 permease-like cell division protein FtsX [Actinoplanes oblitus]